MGPRASVGVWQRSTWVALVVLAGCAAQDPDPRLDSVTPPVVTSLAETSATVHGVDLGATAHLDLDSDETTLDRAWRVEIAGVLVPTTWHDRTQLAVVIPRGLAVGTYDVRAISPDAHVLVLPSALTVTAEPIGLHLAIEDARGGTGLPISGVRSAGDRSDAYAVVRDPAGAFIVDVAVTWGATGPFAHITPSGDHATFQARTVGSGRLTARHDGADLHAESGELTTIAGVAARIQITDMPGSTGVVIGDRSELTTDVDGGLIAYARAVDAFENFAGDATVGWTLVGVAGDLPATSTSFVSVDFSTPGSAMLQATHATLGSTSSGTLTVAPGRATSLEIAPAALTTTADDGPLAFTTSGVDSDGNATANLGTLTWSIASGPISALDSSTGVMDPIRSGTGTIAVASSWGATATSGPIAIAPGAPTDIAITPALAVLSADANPTQFSIAAADVDGNVVNNVSATWSIASGPITAIDAATGILDPRQAGSGSIAASVGSLVATAPVTITAGRARTLAIAPSTLAISQGQAPVAFSATGVDADGNSTTLLGALNWTVASGPFGVLAADGTLTPSLPGAGTVRATNEHGATAVSGPVVVRRMATLEGTLSVASPVALSAETTAVLAITNTGDGAAINVTPCALQITGGATVASGPTPSVAAIGPGSTVTFNWTLATTTVGLKQLTACASGVDSQSSTAVSSPPVSATLLVQNSGVVEVASDPFGDGTRFGFVTGYAGHVYVGPNQTGEDVVRFLPQTAISETQSFAFSRDVTGDRHSNSAFPFYSIGATGCTHNTPACGPHNEDGRGVLTAAKIGGVEWLVLQGAHTDNKPQYLYMSTDSDSELDFRYVDLKQAMPGEAYGATAILGLGSRLYLGMLGKGSGGPTLLALDTMPMAPGLEATASMLTDLAVNKHPVLGPAVSEFDKVDALGSFGGLLYVVTPAGWVRATVVEPQPVNAQPSDWRLITPTAAVYTQLISRPTGTKLTDLEPADRSVPQLATFGGRLFAGRNTTTGPQLWSCQPATSDTAAQCESGDWTLVAPNAVGDVRLTQFDDAQLTSITMITATPQHLYIGFDSTAGVRVFRTALTTATVHSDFEAVSSAGLGTPARTRILDGKAITTGTSTAVWLTLGSGTSALSLVTLQ